ncbi:hypothetical protein PQX77_009164 [Marasmius sp. AFHP31]|nr:hypothetical protein PQX77_009164 [Marasmius sp. AFHP31]
MVEPKSLSPQPSSDSGYQDEEPTPRLPRTGILAMPSEARAPGILGAFSNRIWDDYGDGEWDTWSLRRRILWILLLPPRAAWRTVDYAMDPRSFRALEHGNIFLATYSEVGEVPTFILMLFVAVIFGIFHCIPIMLSYHDFPGHTQDHRLWTVFALLTTVLPLAVSPILIMAGIGSDAHWDNWAKKLIAGITITVSCSSLPVYLIARIGLLVLAAKQLTDLPPSALQQVEWTTLIPHFGV